MAEQAAVNRLIQVRILVGELRFLGTCLRKPMETVDNCCHEDIASGYLTRSTRVVLNVRKGLRVSHRIVDSCTYGYGGQGSIPCVVSDRR